MRITPLVSKDIVGRYVKTGKGIVDHFTGMVIPTTNKRQQSKVYSRLNTLGAVNAQRLQQGKKMLSFLA
jgi:hypothetical protein